MPSHFGCAVPGNPRILNGIPGNRRRIRLSVSRDRGSDCSPQGAGRSAFPGPALGDAASRPHPGGKKEAVRLLAALLPPVDSKPAESETPKDAEAIEWNEEIFSASLASATDRHDHARADSLVAAIVGHLADRFHPYAPQHAYADLQDLRQEREFQLMVRYAEAVIASGTRQDRVRRLFAQALIETREYSRALEVLQSIIDEPDSSQKEIFEAHGLFGRTFKQQYVDAPNAPGAGELIRRAVTAYETVYARDSRQFWHGVNAASCILRAERDSIAAAPRGRAEEIAKKIVEDLDRLSQAGPLQVWDCASRGRSLTGTRPI